MRRSITILLFSLFMFSLSTGLIRADGIILPEALSPDYLAVRYHHVTVDIKDGYALTRVEQEFYNPHSVAVDGRYTFPIPPHAILSNFEARLDGKYQTATRQTKAETNVALYNVISQRRDPSLLQYVDWETLTFDINMPAGASRKMTLQYEEVLPPSGGMYHYHYVLGTERYTTQPLDAVSLTVNVDSSSGLGMLYSSSHPVTTERLGSGRARVRWQAKYVQPVDNFDLFFSPAEGGFGSGLLTGQREGQDHFLLMFAPENVAAQAQVLPKDIIFVVDRSGSMSGEKMEQARNALHYILNQLNPNDRFAMIGFDDDVTVLSDTLQPVNQQTVGQARQFVDSLSADGSTNLEAALQRGLAIFNQSESRSTATKLILFLTDGLPTAGITDTGLITAFVAQSNQAVEARLHVFGVGYDVNTHLLDQLADENGGTVTYVQPGENLELILSEFYRKIATPILTDVEVSFEGIEVNKLHPQQLPDMFQGSSLLLTGQYKATNSNVTVQVRGKAGGVAQEFVYHFNLAQTGNHDFVPRLWATRRVGQLLDKVRVEGETQALVEELQGLGLGYGLVTPYTTFVIQAQSNGAASAENMSLYSNQTDLRQGSGKTTIQARVQNQMYQATDRAEMAAGANIINNNERSVAQVANQNIDLSLLRQQQIEGPVTLQWIADNIHIDRDITFGSTAYFTLADDPAARPYLQSGANVVFAYKGEVIAVRDPQNPPQAQVYPPTQNYQARDEGIISGIVSLVRIFFEGQMR